MNKVNRRHLELETQLLDWFAKHKRPLPWRLDGNPYRIFVVEVMLQQTQIKTVLPYYDRWLKAFPNIHSLARAPIDRVLKLWEGLGYYSRARNLHKAAQMIVSEFQGKVPDTVENLLKLPGIGRYTAGAIASIAYQKPVPLVDGNVSRVLSRLFNLKDDVSKPEAQKKLYALAEKLVPGKRPGDFNQALMELGSLVCTPERPACAQCPLARLCLAFQKGNPEALPIKSKGVRVKKMEMAVGILKRANQVLVRKRPASGIWGGLWELPSIVRTRNQTREAALQKEFKEIGFDIRISKRERPIRHRFTHRDASIYPFRLAPKSKSAALKRNGSIRWADLKALEALSFPAPHRIILNNLVSQ